MSDKSLLMYHRFQHPSPTSVSCLESLAHLFLSSSPIVSFFILRSWFLLLSPRHPLPPLYPLPPLPPLPLLPPLPPFLLLPGCQHNDGAVQLTWLINAPTLARLTHTHTPSAQTNDCRRCCLGVQITFCFPASIHFSPPPPLSLSLPPLSLALL